MSHAEALLAAVVDNPADDAPRLVYADWLGQEADPSARARGELIHFQCALARGPSEQREELERRVADLLEAHRAEWERPFRETGAWALEWRRGFPYCVRVPEARNFVEHREQWFADAPIRALELDTGIPSSIEDFIGCEELRYIESLELDTGIQYDDEEAPRPPPSLGDDGAAILARCRHLTALQRLRLAQHDIGPSGARALADASWMPALVELDLDANPVGASGIAELSRAFTSLARLRLWTPIGPDGAAALAALRRLESVDLTRPQIGMRGARALAESRTLRSLARLKIVNDDLGAEGVAAIAHSPAFRLVDLELQLGETCDDGARTIATAPELARLTRLVFGNITFDGARLLAASTMLGALRELKLLGSTPLPGVEDMFARRSGLPALASFKFDDDYIPF